MDQDLSSNKTVGRPTVNQEKKKKIYIYIYIYADGSLIEPHFSPLCARNMRKRSAKMIFLIKKWPNFGCHFWGSIKLPWFFATFFLFFFAPFLGGDRVFALCFGPGSLRNTGGRTFF